MRRTRLNIWLAIKDLWYLVAIWMIMRLNPYGANELLEKWASVLKERY